MRSVRRFGETPVDVAGTPDDAELDHHLWLRIGELVPDYTRASVLKLPTDVRVYFLTRLFEFEALNDGPEAFVQICPELLGLVAPAYRHLGLDETAQSVDHYVASEATMRLLADPDTLPSAQEVDDLGRMLEEVGVHDAERIAFVRANPHSFSL